MTTIPLVIHSDPDILGGKPVFVCTRVPVRTLLDYLAAGDTLEEFWTISQPSRASRRSQRWDRPTICWWPMRILLDECVPRPLRGELTGHDVHTIWEMGWAGKKNGELLALMAMECLKVLLNMNQNRVHS